MNKTSATAHHRANVVAVAFTILLGAAATMLSGSAQANPAARAPVAIVTARATIMSGVRVTQGIRPPGTRPDLPGAPKPRQRPCPEVTEPRCRLIVTDIP